MKQNSLHRIPAWLLLLAMLLSLLTPMAAAAGTNTGVRHTTCSALSTAAAQYYTGSFTYEQLSLLPGSRATDSDAAMDSELFETLDQLMSATLTQTYSYSSLPNHWANSDTAYGCSDVLYFYSDAQPSGETLSREHVWPKSRGTFYQSGAGSDLHHLRPEDSVINSCRSNYTFGNVTDLVTDYSSKSYNGKTVIWYDSDYTANDCDGLVEVADNVKGDVARILLYVYVTYQQPNLFTRTEATGSGNNDSNGKKVIDSLDTLLAWCELDPVDTWEMQRNDICQSLQGNRNVFIDYPELAWLLFDRAIPDMPTPSGIAHSQGQDEYTVSAVSADAAMGSVSVSGTVVTAVPRDGYVVSGYTLTPADAATVTRSGNSFRLTNLSADCTLTVQFQQQAQATVTYCVPSGATVSRTSDTAIIGSSIALPTVSGQPEAGYTFQGWAAAPVANAASLDGITWYAGSQTYTITNDAVLYALFSCGEPGDGLCYTLVEQTPADWTGHYVLAGKVAGSGEYSVLDGSGTYTGTDIGSQGACTDFAATGASMSEDGKTITDLGAGFVFTVAKSGNGWSIQMADGNYLAYPGGSKNALSTTQSIADDNARWTFSLTDGEATITSIGTNGRYLQFNPNGYFRCYTNSQNPILLYRESGTVGAVNYSTFDAQLPVDPDPNPDPSGVPFADVAESAWYYADVAFAYENGLMNGTGETTFSPDHATNRAMIVTLIYRLAGSPAVAAGNPFTDVPDDQWFTEPIIWAAQENMVNGYGSGIFKPLQAITREQLATILYRCSGSPAVTGDALSGFPDVEQVQAYARPALNWAVQQGLINGVSTNGVSYLRPQGSAPRCQVAAILHRYCTVNAE